MPTTITGDSDVSQIQAGATSGGLPVFQCRAWVNFDGTRDSTGALSTANTARLIRGSGNVSSVVRNGTGDYTVNFTNPLPDANYCQAGTAGNGTNTALLGVFQGQNYLATTTSVRLQTATNAGLQDCSIINVAIFR